MKELFFAIIYIISLYFSGCFISHGMKFAFSRWGYLCVGFVSQLAIIELLGWWMVAFAQSFNLFAALVIGVNLLGMLGGMYVAVYKIKQKHFIKPHIKWEQILLLVVITVLIIFLFLFYRSDADDSFYVSNVLLFSKSDTLNPYDSSFGNSSFGTVPMYDFQIWEGYLAVFSRLFSIKASVLCHFVMVPVLCIIAVSAYLLLGDIIFRESRKSSLFVIILLMIYSMGGYAVYTKGSFLLSRIWQGKAVYLHIVLPIAIAIMLFYLKEQRKTQGILLGAIMLAGIALNPTSMYVIGFQILFMMIAISYHIKRWKGLLHILPTLLVVGVFSAFILLRTHNYNGQVEAASNVPENFAYEVFVNFFGEGMGYFLIYIICCLFILIKGETKGKIICVYTPVLLLLGVWNPLMAPVVAQHLTMVPSYWRVFWLLPIDFAIAYCAVLLFYTKKSVRYKLFIVVGIIVTVMFPGKFMFSESNFFVKAENKERIPSEVLYLGDVIVGNGKDKQIVLANDKGATTLRQEYNDIELIYSRHQYILDLVFYRGRQEEANERIALMQFINGTTTNLDYSYLSDLLMKYQVEWIMIDEIQKHHIAFLEDIGYEIRNEKEGLVLLHNER